MASRRVRCLIAVCLTNGPLDLRSEGAESAVESLLVVTLRIIRVLGDNTRLERIAWVAIQ